MDKGPTYYYVLADDGETPVAVDWADLPMWAVWMGEHRQSVAFDILTRYEVSTIFMGVDYSFGYGPPILWETMVFDREGGILQRRRYTSRADAVAGHDDLRTEFTARSVHSVVEE